MLYPKKLKLLFTLSKKLIMLLPEIQFQIIFKTRPNFCSIELKYGQSYSNDSNQGRYYENHE